MVDAAMQAVADTAVVVILHQHQFMVHLPMLQPQFTLHPFKLTLHLHKRTLHQLQYTVPLLQHIQHQFNKLNQSSSK